MFFILKPSFKLAQRPISKLSVVSNCLVKQSLLNPSKINQYGDISSSKFSTISKNIKYRSNPLISNLINKKDPIINYSILNRSYSQSNDSPSQKIHPNLNDKPQAVGTQQKSKDSIDQSKSEQSSQQTQQGQTSLAWGDLRRLFGLIKYDSKLLAVAIFLLLISCAVGLMLPKAYGLVIDSTKNIIDGELPPIIYGLSLYQFIGVVAALLTVGITANYGRIILLRILGEKMVARLRSNVIKKTISQDAEFFDVNKVGDLISRLGADAFIVSRSMTQNISDGFKAGIVGTAGIGAMVMISPQLASVVFVFVPVVIMGALAFGTRVRAISRKIQQATGNLTRVGEEQLSGIKTVQSFVAEGKELRKYNSAIRNVFRLGRQEAYLNAKFYTGYSLIGDSSFLLILCYGAVLVARGSMTVGDLAAFMMYSEYASNATYNLANFYSELMKGTGAASRLFELIDREPKIHATIGEPLVFKPKGEIEFKDVSFSYPTRPKIQIFNELNFKIPQNSNVCIVGPSGKGKSTVTSLLLRYYDVTKGQILLDGHDISEYSVKSLRRHLGVVQQEPILMSGTIRDNITYGLKETNVDESLIIEAAKKANCHDFITKFPDGYDTIIGPRGALLSGGQKQRISIARALIKNPAVLILDEATSALDSKSEYAINLTLQQLMKDEKLTTISIAHRLSTIRKADMVIVLGYDGKVAEIGNFERLYSDRHSALYRLLNEDKNELEDKKPKKHPNGSNNNEQAGYEDQIDEFTEDFIKKEIIQKGLEDINFDQAAMSNPNKIEEVQQKQ
ncbi:ATP-dependent permease MDL2, mitochondrial [Wickerhamomyces ciferrii]|uniref:ATP-dependent permease MDL2, mitochondrial n=1 Tax=Wickerhamomyces ciferrii (strain ATCC 14091 / BCRC 22168 / CBS 111 / JCM 3599 / NBRC 0793 / NRRL Y-1031 F-60-10) TaxID=1206466 RepID=K0KHC9_WICCF|nr:ATP-dependent permease MDL2, mitochondrial [Wickerhamomyces ciferrii]CCH40578.1 ATP-dependent permease MDL2, mitochondrial [Wickerhamomyces ciferrii]